MKKEPKFRFKGQRHDGVIVESNNIEDFRLQDFTWFEETVTMKKKEVEKMYGKLKNYKVAPHKVKGE